MYLCIVTHTHTHTQTRHASQSVKRPLSENCSTHSCHTHLPPPPPTPPPTPAPPPPAHCGPVPLCTSLAQPTVYFQQLGFGPCHPGTRQPDLPSQCPLTASSAWCPCWQGNTRLVRRGWWCRAVTSALQQQPVVTDLHCRRIRHHIITKKNAHN